MLINKYVNISNFKKPTIYNSIVLQNINVFNFNNNNKVNNDNNEDEFNDNLTNLYLPKNLSRKTGLKCCPYGQTGLPLSSIKVKDFLSTFNKNNSNAKNFKWIEYNNYNSLKCSFYFINVFKMLDFLKEIYQFDLKFNIQQIPNIKIIKQEILNIELYTHQLKGLSNKDLHLASIISTIDINNYSLYPLVNKIEDIALLKKEIRSIDINNKSNNSSIIERSKLKNKYDELI